MSIRAAVVSALAVGAVVLTPAVASAAPALNAPATVGPGETFTISGTGCMDPADDTQVPRASLIVGGFYGVVDAAPDGSWSMSVDLGLNAPRGYPVKAICHLFGSAGFDYPTVTVTLVGPPVPGPADIPGMGPGAGRPPRPPFATAPGSSSSSRAPAAPTPAGTSTTVPPAPVPAVVPSETSAPATPTSPLVPTAAPGCADCALLGGDEALRPGQELALAYVGFAPGEQSAW